MLNAFDLPPVCVVTGKTEGVQFRPVKFAWYPRWIAVFAPFALLIAIILMLVLTRRVKGELPFTDEAWRRWRLAKVLFPLSVFFGIAAFIGMSIAAGDGSGALALVLLVLSIGVPLAVGLALYRGSGPSVQKLTDTHITLKLPSAEAGAVIFRHLISGALRADPDAIRASA